MPPDIERIALKMSLMEKTCRIWKAPAGSGSTWAFYGNLCWLCGRCCVEVNPRTGFQNVLMRLDLHEAIISRGDARGNKNVADMILSSPYNCVLVCEKCNVGRIADTKHGTDKLISVLISMYGKDPIIAWLKTIPLETINEFIQRVNKHSQTDTLLGVSVG